MMPSRPVVFLDRDGVINRRLMDDYVTGLDEFELLPGVLPALALLTRAGFRLVVVTNQRGIAINRMSREDVDAIHNHLSELAEGAGAVLEEFYVCPHDRDEGCPCRKPKAGLLDQAYDHEALDWRQAFLVGDSDSDIRAAKARGVTAIKLMGLSEAGADYHFDDLAQASVFIAQRPPTI